MDVEIRIQTILSTSFVNRSREFAADRIFEKRLVLRRVTLDWLFFIHFFGRARLRTGGLDRYRFEFLFGLSAVSAAGRMETLTGTDRYKRNSPPSFLDNPLSLSRGRVGRQLDKTSSQELTWVCTSFFLSFFLKESPGRSIRNNNNNFSFPFFLRKRNSSKDETSATSEKATQVKIERDEANEKDWSFSMTRDQIVRWIVFLLSFFLSFFYFFSIFNFFFPLFVSLFVPTDTLL